MKYLRRILVGLVAFAAIVLVALVVWATLSAQEATQPAQDILQANNIEREDGLLRFEPRNAATTGVIYYPGGLVEPEAYAGTAQGLADEGYLVVIPKMPLNLAFTGINRADEIRAHYPEIEAWVIGGHSLGGAMAAEYAKNHVDQLAGLILFASYPANYDDFVDFPLPILSIIGSKDPGAIEQRAFYDHVSESATLFIVEGGNHRQYADYSFQRGDSIPTISAAEQHALIVAGTVEFLKSVE